MHGFALYTKQRKITWKRKILEGGKEEKGMYQTSALNKPACMGAYPQSTILFIRMYHRCVKLVENDLFRNYLSSLRIQDCRTPTHPTVAHPSTLLMHTKFTNTHTEQRPENPFSQSSRSALANFPHHFPLDYFANPIILQYFFSIIS